MEMFCYQCQETAKGTGCTIQGICGKKAETSARMDLLLYAVRGISKCSDIKTSERHFVSACPVVAPGTANRIGFHHTSKTYPMIFIMDCFNKKIVRLLNDYN